jgi:dUTP pyrophosphatase
MKLVLGFYKTHPDVKIPEFATDGSACFDLAFSPAGKSDYIGYSKTNRPILRRFFDTNGNIIVAPGDRIIVPTGLVMDIPRGGSVRIHPRSGTALKQGLTMINSEGVIDSDYVEEVGVLLWNTSEVNIIIQPGERIAQGELVELNKYSFTELKDRPIQKTRRNGGYGSTGAQEIKA